MADSPETQEAFACFSKADELWQKYQTSQDIVDLDGAISMQRRVVELLSEDNPNMPDMLMHLLFLFKSRNELLTEPGDLESICSVFQRAINNPSMPALLNEDFHRTIGLDDLDCKISMTRSVVELISEEGPTMSAWLHNLASYLNNRFQRLGELKDLEDAIATQRRAADITPEGHPDMPSRLEGLQCLLRSRFERLEELDDLNSAISVGRRAIALTPQGHSRKAIRLGNLNQCLLIRFKRFGELSDLDSVISTQDRLIELTSESEHTSEGHDLMRAWLITLGGFLGCRFQRLGELDDLERAISTGRRALALTPEGHSDMAVALQSLAGLLIARYEHFDELEDLDSAISMQRRAVFLEGHEDMPERFTNFGVYLCARFGRLGNACDIENAVVLQRHAVDLAPEGYPCLPLMLSCLALSLHKRFKHFGEINDLDSAISMQRRSIELLPKDHFDMSRHLHHLGTFLTTRFQQFKERDDLESAISMQLCALDLTPEGHFDKSMILDSLGISLLARFHCFDDPNGFEAAIESFIAGASQTNGAPSLRISCARTWAYLETRHPDLGSSDSLLKAHSCVIKILPEAIWLGFHITKRYQYSANVARYVYDAVSAAIKLGALEQAVKWLDAGRGLVWSQIHSLRTPVDDLAQHHPDLAREFQKLSADLQSAHLVQLPRPTCSVDSFFDDERNQHRRAVIDYESCLKKIRACSGFEDFLRAKTVESLTSITEHLDGPFVYINVSSTHAATTDTSSRCDALVIFPGGTVQLIPLSDLTPDRANQLHDYYSSYIRFSEPTYCSCKRGLALSPDAQADKFMTMLDLLWEWVVHPILEALGFMNRRQGQLPHITWCPTGPLTQLPFHAAGFRSEPGQAGLYVYDFVVSSYAPSLSALVRAQESITRSTSPPSVLIVTQPATPNQSALPSASAEGARLQEILGKSKIGSKVFSNAQATVESIQSAIGQFPWIHLACHGVQDPSIPIQSAFALHDGKLTLSTLMKTVSKGAELAFLSACQTATGDKNAPEESVHLAAGMLAVGFKGVVGTMWSIDDEDAPVVVEAYYKKLLELRNTDAVGEGSTGAAYALHEAVKVLREQVGRRNVLKWVPFVHYGV